MKGVWAISEEYVGAVSDIMEFRANGITLSREDVAARFGGQRSIPTHPTGNAIAVIPIAGVISEEYGVSPSAIGAQVDAAMANDSVGTIVLAINSPGGEVTGVPELAAKIAEARGRKRVVAVAEGDMASAAYWIGSQAQSVSATPSARVGSIGVFTAHADVSGALANAGINVTLISAGKYKTEASPFAPLGTEAKEAIQARIDEVYGDFVSAVASGRGVTTAAVINGFGQGRVESARGALAAGMIDTIGGLGDVLGGLLGSSPPTPMHASSNQLAAVTGGFFVPVTETFGTPEATLRLVSPAPAGASSPSGSVPKEKTVSDIPAVAPGAAPNAAEPRDDAMLELADAHGKTLADVRAWRASGKTVEQVRADLLASYATNAAPTPTIANVHHREVDKPWGSFGEQLKAVHHHAIKGGANADLRLYAAATGMSQGSPADGGFTVAPQFSSMIWDKMSSAPENLLSRCDTYPVEGESLTFNANAETSRATGSRYGGVRGYWINEADAITASSPKFRQVRVEPQELGVLVYVTDKLLNNSGAALEQYVGNAASEEINWLVNEAIINGSGVGQPKGLKSAACTVSVAKETNQANDTIVQRNISKMWARMHPRSRANAVWLHNVDIEPQLDALSTTVMNVGETENVGGYANKVFDPERRTLKGRPLIAIEQCATLGDVGDIILADLKGYLAGVRGGIKSAISMHVRFVQMEQAFRFNFAVDGQPWLASALTPANGSNTLSTFVTLAAR